MALPHLARFWMSCPEVNECPSGAAVVQVRIVTLVVHSPVLIQTYIEANTTININGGFQININNAPTTVSTVVVGTTTTTVTETFRGYV